MKQEKRAGQAALLLIIGGLGYLIGSVESTGCISQTSQTLQNSYSLVSPPKPIFDLTKHVEVLDARLVSSPCTSIDTPPVKGTCHEVLVKWRNNGPSPIGHVRAKIQTWDDVGNELPYSLDIVSIFGASDPKDRIAKGRVYDQPVGSGHTLLMGEMTPVKVKVTVVYADNTSSH